MSLQEQLKQIKQNSAKNIPDDIRAVMGDALQSVINLNLEANAPKVGDQLPEFSLVNQSKQTRRLSDFLAKGPAIITFYRGGWCPYCNLELKAYQTALGEIQSAGGNLIAITPELPDASLSTQEKNELGFDVLSDVDSAYARELGIVFTLSEELKPIYERFGIDLSAHNGEGQFDLPLAATFVVDQKAQIASAFVESDYTQRQEPQDAVNILKSIAG